MRASQSMVTKADLRDYMIDFVTGLPQWRDREDLELVLESRSWPEIAARAADQVFDKHLVSVGIRTSETFTGYRIAPSCVDAGRFAILEITGDGATSISFCHRDSSGNWNYKGYREAGHKDRVKISNLHRNRASRS